MKSKLILGIDETTNIQTLLDDGIRQFYFGYITKKYLQDYSTQTSLNRRYRLKEQYSSYEHICKTIEKIHTYNGTIYLALNSFTSNATMLQYSQELYEMFEAKVDGMIVANITIALMLKKRDYKNIVISNLFGVYSCEAVSFLQMQFNPIKIILPRDISLDNIKKIVTTYPQMQFECFLYGDNCRYSESFCFTEHGYDSLDFGSLCSYSTKEKKLIKSAIPTFKQIVKNSTLSDDEKKQLLQKEQLSIEYLLDKLLVLNYEFNSKKISHFLEILSMFDIQMFYANKELYIKALSTLGGLEFNKAQTLLKKLKEKPFQPQDSYKSFHNLNTNAIQRTMIFFAQFKNITSYKIPSRGRDFYKYIFANKNEEYNYKESQYRLEQ